MPGFEPTNIWTLIPWLLVYGLPAGLLYLQQRKGRKESQEFRAAQEAKTDAIHEQTVNSHKTNLREDMDQIRDLVKDGFGRVDERLDGVDERLRIVQRDLSIERQERIDGDKKD
jgi:hypothetical protein